MKHKLTETKVYKDEELRKYFVNPKIENEVFGYSKVPGKRGVLISRGFEICVKYNKWGIGISGGGGWSKIC